MALIAMDGFDQYSSLSDTTTGGWYWAESYAAFGSSYRRWSPGAGIGNPSGNIILPFGISGTYVCGFAFVFPVSAGYDPRDIAGWGNGGTIWYGYPDHKHLVFCTTGENRIALYAARWNGAVGTLIATSSRTFTPGTWYYFELKSTLHPTNGSAEVRINGDTVISVTGVRTQDGDSLGQVVGEVWFGKSVTAQEFYSNWWMDDFYVCDTTGTTNNDFLGDVWIQTLYPNANTTVAQWTGSDGNQVDNYALLNEGPPVNYSTYVESNTVGQVDLYGFTDLSATSGPVRGVKHIIWASKPESGSRTVASVHRQSGVIYEGAPFGITSSGIMQSTIYGTNPATGLPWTIAEINSTEFGQKVVS